MLFVHPEGHLNDYVVPVGALGCMNAIRATKLGRFAFEVRDDEIRRARVIAFDLHWAVGLPGFSRLVRHVRVTNPSATLVAGGISAGLWAPRLLDELPLDFVIRGDSEIAFTKLTDAVLSGRDPSRIANVVSRDVREPVLSRMTHADLDAVDSVSAQWFPTFQRAAQIETEALSHACTISVTRGCAMRCRSCYGSFGQSFGPGQLIRAPESVVRSVAAARESGAPRLRLFLGKPSPARLSALCRALADAGPYHFESEVGLFCCTPPSAEDAACLEAAFPRAVAISATHPAEHEPAPSREQVASEWGAWRELGAEVSRSSVLSLDFWSHDPELVAEAARELPTAGNARATWAGAWELTRPTDATAPADLDTVSEAVTPLWTSAAARLLSPALEELLRPYGWLDDLAEDPDSLPLPSGPLGRAAAELRSRWQRHRLPAFPGFELAVVLLPRSAVRDTDKGIARVDDASLSSAPPIWLARSHGHDGLEFVAQVEIQPEHQVASLVANASPGLALDGDWLSAIAERGLLSLELRDRRGLATVRVFVTNHQARWTIDADDGTWSEAAELSSGFFRSLAP